METVAPVSPNPKPRIKNWEYFKFDNEELVGIFKGKEAEIFEKDKIDIMYPTALLYAKHDPTFERRVRLDTPRQKDVKKLDVGAEHGNYNDRSKLLKLKGSVVVQIIGENILLKTDTLTIDTEKKSIYTDSKFTLSGPDFFIKGTGLVADEFLGKIIVTSHGEITKIDKEKKIYIKTDHIELFLDKTTNTESGKFAYEITNFVASGSKMSQIISGDNIIHTAKIIGYGSPDVIVLKGPKIIEFDKYTIRSSRDVLINIKDGIIKLFEAQVDGSDIKLESQVQIIKLSSDKHIDELIAYGNVKIWHKMQNVRISADILRQNFRRGVSDISANPYIKVSNENGTIKTEQVLLDSQKNTIESHKKKKRSTILIEK